MIKRIDMFLPPFSNHKLLENFTEHLHDALVRARISSRTLKAEHNNPRPFLELLFQDKPDCTLSFNGLLPDEQGRFFCELIKIPHVAALIHSPINFLALTATPLTIIACTDRYFCDFFRGMNAKNVIFLPHAVDRELVCDPKVQRSYDVVFFGSCIDIDAVRASWKSQFSEQIVKSMEEAVDITLSDVSTSYIEAFVGCLDRDSHKSGQSTKRDMQIFKALDQIETYVKGKDRIDLIRSIKDARVDIFAAPTKGKGWSDYLGKQANVTIHDAVSYDEMLSIYCKTKIVLNSSPWSKQGGHERIFSGLACGAAVLTDENAYLREEFRHGESILFYQHKNLSAVNQLINDYLSKDNKRVELAKKGQKIVMQRHTWDHRAHTLLQELPLLLENINVRKS